MISFDKHRETLETLTQRVRGAEDSLLDGKIPDLGDLEHRASVLCRSITGGEPATAKALQPFMADLISALDSLAERLEAHTARLKS